MALFHLSVTQTKRSAGQSAIASAAYRAGERLYSEYYGEYSDYTRKGGVICSDILLPSHAPPEYADRQTLWNAVEKAERGKNAQLAYSFDIALQNEFSLEENIALANLTSFIFYKTTGQSRFPGFAFLYVENHSLGEWFKRRLMSIMGKEKLPLLYWKCGLRTAQASKGRTFENERRK